MEDIYSDIRGEILTPNNEADSPKVYLYDNSNGRYNPNLIIPNQLAIRNLIKFLDDCLYKITRNRYTSPPTSPSATLEKPKETNSSSKKDCIEEDCQYYNNDERKCEAPENILKEYNCSPS